MGAEIRQHNLALRQMAVSFPVTHQGSSVYLFDFGTAFSQVRPLSALAALSCMLVLNPHPPYQQPEAVW